MKKKMSLVLNLLIVIFEIIGLMITFNLNHRIAIEYYTEDSNILALFSSLLFVIYLIRNKNIPRWLELFKYMTTICLTVTFLVVIFILAPMYNFNYYYMLFYNNLIFQHLLCPIISIITFIFFDNLSIIDKKDSLIGITLTLLYAFVLIILNVFKLIEGPYPFLMVYNQTIYMSIVWFILIIGLSYLISLFLKKLCLKYGGSNENRK